MYREMRARRSGCRRTLRKKLRNHGQLMTQDALRVRRERRTLSTTSHSGAGAQNASRDARRTTRTSATRTRRPVYQPCH